MIYVYLTGFVKRCLQKLSKQPNSAVVKSTKASLPTPVLIAHTTANHPATAHCGLTLIGADQRQTIIQAYTRPEKIAKASDTVNSHLMRPQTLTTVKVSTQPPPPPPGLCF